MVIAGWVSGKYKENPTQEPWTLLFLNFRLLKQKKYLLSRHEGNCR
jgi:hypothetical protein